MRRAGLSWAASKSSYMQPISRPEGVLDMKVAPLRTPLHFTIMGLENGSGRRGLAYEAADAAGLRAHGAFAGRAGDMHHHAHFEILKGA
ncbi:hypothetical protein CHELA1G2_14272 [Hyphomicrobiales bacterium]|nr:hypothetical protein CHELA1G2_14272 [Hyphomicrobiales bacterium]